MDEIDEAAFGVHDASPGKTFSVRSNRPHVRHRVEMAQEQQRVGTVAFAEHDVASFVNVSSYRRILDLAKQEPGKLVFVLGN
ncbi:hypothetical protein D3C71_1599680 [compost metagenome]